jgi:hypothetical protein
MKKDKRSAKLRELKVKPLTAKKRLRPLALRIHLLNL